MQTKVRDSIGGIAMPSDSLLYLSLRVQKHISNNIFIDSLLHALIFMKLI